MERPCIRISVRNLVEFILRSGDLDNRRSKMADKEAMLMGGELHRKIRKKEIGERLPGEKCLRDMKRSTRNFSD